MPTETQLTIEYDEARDLFTVVPRGPVGAEGFVAGFRNMLCHPGYHPGVKVLVNMLEHVHAVDGEGIRQIAAVFAEEVEALRGVAVASVVSKAVSYGMLRMLQTMVSGLPFSFSVFYDLKEAEESLGLT